MFIIMNKFIYHTIFGCEENSLKIEYKSPREFFVPHSFNR